MRVYSYKRYRKYRVDRWIEDWGSEGAEEKEIYRGVKEREKKWSEKSEDESQWKRKREGNRWGERQHKAEDV